MLFKNGCIVVVLFAALMSGCSESRATLNSPPHTWPLWQKYRTTVHSPAGAIKDWNIERARENLHDTAWAKEYLASLQEQVDPWLPKINDAFLQEMIPETTPGASGFTPCPSCRDLGKPFLPHGRWEWDPHHPDQLKCKVCGAVFPNAKYPEDVVLHTTWGKPQALTFSSAEPFKLFAYKGEVRPSMTGNIRVHKVTWIAGLAKQLAETYILTQDPKYAVAVRSILLRLSEVYPNWLLHTAYGEYMDMDPLVAAEHMTDLPKDELVVPPNKPDRDVYVTFWVAGRATGSGGESLWVIPLATAYDITRHAQLSGKPLYSDADQIAIEKKLLLESTIHLVADKKINNKSVGNRSAAALVGMIVGDPELVRFGIEGFDLTVNDWFLPDGSTPESPAYALMVLHRIADFAQALRGYTDPPGYLDASKKRYDDFDPYHQTNYNKVWQAMFKTLQGDLRYPPFADSYVTSSMGSNLLEKLAANYPDQPQYTALLKAVLKGDWKNTVAKEAIYLAEPGREKKPVPQLILPDNCLPDLRIGFMRTGDDGRESLLTLSANHWGGHHHRDSLNLYYWKNGKELLSDLGYLHDHPDRGKTVRTFAHNTVMIDEAEQEGKRGGDVKYFLAEPHVKAMRAASTPYKQATIYERAATLIDHGNGKNYALDVFWAQGGKTQDYIFHGPNNKLQITAPTAANAGALYDLKNIRKMQTAASTPWRMNWQMSADMEFTAWNLPQQGEEAYVGDGWGQRDSYNKDRGATLPYVIRRTQNGGLDTFVSLFEAHPTGKPLVQKIQQLAIAKTSIPAIALQIDTTESRDYVVLSRAPQSLQVQTPDGTVQCEGTLAVISVQKGKSTFTASDAGKVLLRK